MGRETSPLLPKRNIVKSYSSFSNKSNGGVSNGDPCNHLVSLCWSNISVSLKPQRKNWFRIKSMTPKEGRFILKGVSGKVGPGQVLAILGPSGAGKTTLMNVLTSRNLHKVNVYGKVTINGYSAGSLLPRMSAYVQQEDLFIATLTVREHLKFQALLRMDQKLPRRTRMQRIEEVIAELGLSQCADTKIGIPGKIKGISGGEMKRLSFASEILTNPSLMFCDEPTSGLDAFMALSVVSVLKEMAAGGCTIVCTIHQPSSEVYAMFDQVLYLADGQVAYLGNTNGALSFFSKIGLQCPSNFNPADYFINELSVIPGEEVQCRRQIQRICEEFADFQERPASKQPLTKHTADRMDVIEDQSRYTASWLVQFYVILWRSFLSVKRERLLTTMRFVQTMAVALLLGLFYWQQNLDQDSIININGVLFLLLTNVTFQNLFAVVSVFCTEIPVFLREHWNGMYRIEVYFICKMISELPFFLLLPALFTTVVYWMVGLRAEVYSFLLCVVIVVLASNAACSCGYLISCFSKSLSVALYLGPPIIIPLMLFGGFLLNNGSIPAYFLWVKYLSWFYYGNEALCIVQWSGVKHIACGNATICIKDGDTVLNSLNFEKKNLYLDIGLLGVLVVGYRLIALAGLALKTRQKK